MFSLALMSNTKYTFVDKNLRYHGLIQAFYEINRIYDAKQKPWQHCYIPWICSSQTLTLIMLFG